MDPSHKGPKDTESGSDDPILRKFAGQFHERLVRELAEATPYTFKINQCTYKDVAVHYYEPDHLLSVELEVGYSDQSEQRFRLNPNGDSDSIRTPIPISIRTGRSEATGMKLLS